MLILTYEVNRALSYAADFKPGIEVGGFGHTTLAENGIDIIVDDIFIPPQTVQSAHTDIKGPGEQGGDGMLETAIRHWAFKCKWCYKALGEHDGADHEFEGQAWSDNRLWWHSHGKIGATPSATDDGTLQKLARLLDGWCAGLVINSAGDRHPWASVYRAPFNLITQKLEFGVYKEERLDIKERVDAMMAHVEEKVWSYQGNSQGAKGGTGTSNSPPNVRRLPQRTSTPTGKRIIDLPTDEFAKWLESEEGRVPLHAE